MNAKEFEKKLESLDGFKSIFGGLFGGGRAKASFENEDTLQIITERANDMSLGTIRHECLGYTKLEPYRGQPGSNANENTEITSIADDFADLFVFPIGEGSEQKTEDSSVTGGFAAARITVFCPLSSVLW